MYIEVFRVDLSNMIHFFTLKVAVLKENIPY